MIVYWISSPSVAIAPITSGRAGEIERTALVANVVPALTPTMVNSPIASRCANWSRAATIKPPLVLISRSTAMRTVICRIFSARSLKNVHPALISAPRMAKNQVTWASES
jgi:hypothetical protein